MTREEAYAELVERHECAEYVDSDYVDCVSIEALEIAIEALKGRLEIDNETMKSDFGEVELRGIKNFDLPERFTATDCSCLNCKNRHSIHCEPQNKKVYGYCGNWERR